MINFEKTNQILTKVDRMISGQINITIKKTNRSIAYTKIRTREIFINPKELSTLDDESSLKVHKGLNYHELSHIIFTKVNWRKHHTIKNELNILEDSKIENLFTLDYPKSSKYFKDTCLKFIDSQKEINYILIYGRRKFLDAELIKKVGNLFSDKFGKDVKRKAEKIINSYLINKEIKKSYDLGYKLADLLKSIQESPDNVSDSSSLSSSTRKKEVDGLTKDLIDELKESLNIKDKEIKNTKVTKGKIEENVSKAIKETNKEINEENKEEIKSNISGGKELGGEIYIPMKCETQDVDKLKSIFNKVKNDLRNGYKTRMKRGKFDIRRLIQNQANKRLSNKVFKKFVPDRKNETNMGVAIQIDSSSSVRNPDFKRELSTAYIISKALEDTKSSVCIFEFSTRFKLIKDFNRQEGEWARHFFGGTRPDEALEESFKKLMKLKREKGVNTLINFLITDGYFNHSSKADEIISKMNRKGIITVIVNIRFDGLRHNCKHSISIKKTEDLLPKMDKVIKEIQNSIRNKIVDHREEMY